MLFLPRLHVHEILALWIVHPLVSLSVVVTCLFIYLVMYICIYLFVCLFVYFTLFFPALLYLHIYNYSILHFVHYMGACMWTILSSSEFFQCLT